MVNEINRILKLFANFQHGKCWIGTNFKKELHGVCAGHAFKTICAITNSTWQLVAHITYWRTAVVNRLAGSDKPPPFFYFLLPENYNEENWKQALHDFEFAYHLLRNATSYLSNCKNDKGRGHTC